MSECNLLVDGLSADLFVIIGVEWQVSREHQVDDNTEGPAVDTFVVWLLKKDLRSHIAEGSEWLVASLSWTEGLTQTKVD